MAFNPFANFQKYKQVYMGAVFLLTMGTFVLCTGTQADIGNRVIEWFSGKGTPVWSINGSTYRDEDLRELSTRRKAADKFMKVTFEFVKSALEKKREEGAKKEETDPAQEAEYAEIILKSDMASKQKRYFPGGYASKDLMEFQLWLAEADRLNIHFEPEQIEFLWRKDTLQNRFPRLFEKDWAVNTTLREFHKMQPAALEKALTDEYRVLAVKLIRESSFNEPWDKVFADYKAKTSYSTLKMVPVVVADLAKDVTIPDDVKDKEVAKVIEELKGNAFDPTSEKWSLQFPARAKFKVLSANAKDRRFTDPARAGLVLGTSSLLTVNPLDAFSAGILIAAAPEVERGFLLANLETPGADQRTPAFVNQYRTLSVFDKSYPLHLAQTILVHGVPGSNEAASPLAVHSLVASIASGPSLGALNSYWNLPLYDLKTKKSHEKEFKKLVDQEFRRRAKVFATMLPASSPMESLIAFAQVAHEENHFFAPGQGKLQAYPKDLPFLSSDLIRRPLEKLYVESKAKGLTAALMVKLRDYLNSPELANVKLDLRLHDFKSLRKNDRLGKDSDGWLEEKETKDFHSYATVKDAPELAALKKSFESSGVRSLVNNVTFPMKQERVLGDEQFFRLFFEPRDAALSLDLKVPFTAAEVNKVTTWPPTVSISKEDRVTIRLQESAVSNEPDKLNAFRESLKIIDLDRPMDLFAKADESFIFWRSEEKKQRTEAELQEKALETAKLIRAQQEAYKKAKALGEKLINSKKHYSEAFEELSADEKKGLGKAFTLPRVAPWVPVGNQYAPFKVPANTSNAPSVEYPPKDLAKDLLELYNLKEAKIDGEHHDLNTLNRDLLDLAGKHYAVAPGKKIQVYANSPRTVFYLTWVENHTERTEFDFKQEAVKGPNFLFRIQEVASKEFQVQYMDQLRTQYKFKAIMPEERIAKLFESESSAADAERDE